MNYQLPADGSDETTMSIVVSPLGCLFVAQETAEIGQETTRS